VLEQAYPKGLQPIEGTHTGAILEGLQPTQGPSTDAGKSVRRKKQQRGTVMD